MVYDLEFRAVYHYRNRWALGKIKGRLDLKNRNFIPKGRKIGVMAINGENINKIPNLNDYVTLRTFLTENIVRDIPNSFKEAEYIERLILKATDCKKMWIDSNNCIIKMFAENYKLAKHTVTCRACGLQWSVYPHLANPNAICSDCRRKKDALDIAVKTKHIAEINKK